MKRLSLAEAIEGLKSLGYEVEDLGRKESYRYGVLTLDHQTEFL